MPTSLSDLLQPAYLRSVQGLALLARHTLQAVLPGINRSLRTGPGFEFSQYRSYQPGDDLRYLDWKLYARSDRFYIREAERESHLTLRFVLDASASMLHEDQGIQKIDYARYVIATLAWLAQQQGDQIALHALSGQQIYQVPPGASHRHFSRFLHQMLQIECRGAFPETIANNGLEGAKPQNEIIIFISDLYAREHDFSDTLKALRSSHNELLVFHLMAHNELELDFKNNVTLEDLETGQRIQLDAKAYRNTYLKQLKERLNSLKIQMLDWNAYYELMQMNELPGQALRAFLKRRNHLL